MHESWCKERPKDEVKKEEKEPHPAVVVTSIVNGLLKNVCDESSIIGGWRKMKAVNESMAEVENIDEVEQSPASKKSRKSYSYVKQAEILEKLQNAQEKDGRLSLSTFAETEGISKSMISR